MKMIIPEEITYSDFSINLTDSTEGEFDYSGSTNYNKDDTVKVSFEKDGTTRILPEKTFTVISTDPTNEYPIGSTKWLDNGAVNRHKMFDKYINTQAEAFGTEVTDPGKIVFTIKTDRQNAIALFGVEGTSVKYELKDYKDTIVETYENTNLDEGYIQDFEEYIYKPFPFTHDLVQYFSSYLVSKLTVTIERNETGLYPKCGYVIVGQSVFIGYTNYGVETGYLSFSKVNRDSFGNVYAQKGNYAKLMTLPLTIDNVIYDKVQAAAIAVDGIPTVFDGNNEEFNTGYESLLILGLLIDFRPIIQYFDISEVSMKIEGII